MSINEKLVRLRYASLANAVAIDVAWQTSQYRLVLPLGRSHLTGLSLVSQRRRLSRSLTGRLWLATARGHLHLRFELPTF